MTGAQSLTHGPGETDTGAPALLGVEKPRLMLPARSLSCSAAGRLPSPPPPGPSRLFEGQLATFSPLSLTATHAPPDPAATFINDDSASQTSCLTSRVEFTQTRHQLRLVTPMNMWVPGCGAYRDHGNWGRWALWDLDLVKFIRLLIGAFKVLRLPTSLAVSMVSQPSGELPLSALCAHPRAVSPSFPAL
ncbi:hypothetical protein NDU88_005852 [Pleurodeles waltl]|uniref:Uncharacterized protein n=1 Tax=Pleurodeles waltl TaxID=8319 RepID=A0AAV7PK24_PLEWA|nr:hypothetical protein NDU88_005852 [Pleurodeles waltl]